MLDSDDEEDNLLSFSSNTFGGSNKARNKKSKMVRYNGKEIILWIERFELNSKIQNQQGHQPIKLLLLLLLLLTLLLTLL